MDGLLLGHRYVDNGCLDKAVAWQVTPLHEQRTDQLGKQAQRRLTTNLKMVSALCEQEGTLSVEICA